ncbi:hypothetical protein Tco_0828601 [Tanacetum coccineum]
MECKVGTLMENAISLMGRSESIFRMSSNMMRQLPPEPSHQEAFEDLLMNFILDQEERVKQLEEYMGVIGSDFMQFFLKVVEKLKDEIRVKENRVKKIEKITSTYFHVSDFISPKSLCVKYVSTILPSPPLVRESNFGFNSGTNNNRNIKSRYDVKNLNPQSTPQVLSSFEENTPPVTYPDEVEDIIGIPIEVEPLDETPLEDLSLNTCNHDIPLSFKEIPKFDEPEPQPQPLPSCPSLYISLGEERGPEPPIKPHSPDSFRMKVIFDEKKLGSSLEVSLDDSWRTI